MTPDFIIGFAREAIEITLMISLPMLGVGLVVGMFVSVLQAATQINEVTLSFVPKLLVMFLTLLLVGPWMITMLTDYIRRLFIAIPTLIG